MKIYFFILAATSFFAFFMWFTLVSYFEHEKLATKRSFTIGFLIAAIYFSFIFLPPKFQNIIFYTSISGFVILILLFLLPEKRSKNNIENSDYRIDERDTMFSRKEIMGSKEKTEDYYSKNPDKTDIDKEWQKKPGLLAAKSHMYNKTGFLAADASFFAIGELKQSVHTIPAIQVEKKKPTEITRFIKNWSKKLGAIDVGICELKPQHYYSHRGRGAEYGNKVEIKHKYAIAFTVEMDKEFLDMGPAAPTVMESAQQYLNSGTIAIQVANFLSKLGYDSRAHIDGNYEVVCPLIARDAGMGEIGRMGLLMTPKLGPRVRISVVTTDIPLEIDSRNLDNTVHDFCNICKKCAYNCPGNAISEQAKKLVHGTERWQINQEKCFSYWCTVGTDCGRCMSVCPYSHPNNLLHNLVRWGIRKSWLFRPFALKLDDFFYGKKPKPTKTPDWIKI